MKNLYSDTIVAPATTPGTGAISIIRISGPEAFKLVDAVVKLKQGNASSAKPYTIHLGQIYSKETLLDEVLVSVFRAPHSYTGEDLVEISCHASSYIATEIIGLLLQAGARFAQPGEFTRRAFLNGKMDLSQAEAVADVISSEDLASHRVAMNQLRGSYSSELEGIRAQLLEMASLMELELDFSEEDVEFADRKTLLHLVKSTREHIDSLASSFKSGNLMKNGVPVAIVGAVNAGKSTLLNAILGDERAIVSPIPGTTRDTVEDSINLGWIRFRFIDTAGIRNASDPIEKIGIERTFKAISQAEIVLFLIDSSEEKFDLLNNLQQFVNDADISDKKLVLLLNKVDLLSQDDINKSVTTLNNFVLSLSNECVILEISAKEKIGTEKLKDVLVSLERGLLSNANSTFITNTRHLEALQKASTSLLALEDALVRNIPTDLAAEELRASISSINQILGHDLSFDNNSVLENIFKHHCIGK